MIPPGACKYPAILQVYDSVLNQTWRTKFDSFNGRCFATWCVINKHNLTINHVECVTDIQVGGWFVSEWPGILPQLCLPGSVATGVGIDHCLDMEWLDSLALFIWLDRCWPLVHWPHYMVLTLDQLFSSETDASVDWYNTRHKRHLVSFYTTEIL